MADVKFIYVPDAVTEAQVNNFDEDTIYFVAGAYGEDPKIYKGSTIFANAGDLATLREQIGTLPVDQEYDDLIDYIDSQIAASETSITSTLAQVASTGSASDVFVAGLAEQYNSNDVESILGEIATSLSSIESGVAVTLTSASGGASDAYATRYTVMQGGTTVGTIDIGKDMVATNGTLVQPTAANPITIDGNTVTSGTYIEMTIANGDPFYIDVVDLIEYNSVSSTDEITLTDTNHIISATVGEISGTKVIYQAASGSDAAVTVNQKIAALESAIGTGIDALDADVDAVVQSASPDTYAVAAVSGVTEVDGIITGVDSVDVDRAGAATAVQTAVIGTAVDNSSASTIYGAKAYADAAVAAALTWGSLS